MLGPVNSLIAPNVLNLIISRGNVVQNKYYQGIQIRNYFGRRRIRREQVYDLYEIFQDYLRASSMEKYTDLGFKSLSEGVGSVFFERFSNTPKRKVFIYKSLEKG